MILMRKFLASTGSILAIVVRARDYFVGGLMV